MPVRLFSAADTEAVQNIVKNIGRSPRFNWGGEDMMSELNLAVTLVFCADSGEVLSFLSYREALDFNEITVLGTDPDFRKKSYSMQLIDYLQNKSRAAGKRILLEVHAENRAAIGLYEKCGFAKIATRKAYYADGANALVYEFA